MIKKIIISGGKNSGKTCPLTTLIARWHLCLQLRKITIFIIPCLFFKLFKLFFANAIFLTHFLSFPARGKSPNPCENCTKALSGWLPKTEVISAFPLK